MKKVFRIVEVSEEDLTLRSEMDMDFDKYKDAEDYIDSIFIDLDKYPLGLTILPFYVK